MLRVQPVFVLLIVKCCSPGFDNDQATGNVMHPWIGILKVDSGSDKVDAATGVIMIGQHLAVGNAHDVAIVNIDVLRTSAKAMFYRLNMWWECGVKDRVLHPEFFLGIKNTIGIIYLSCNKEGFYWVPVRWPTENTTYINVSIVGITDRNQWLQQVTAKMEAVNDAYCEDFYRKEKLDYKSLQPTHNICYKELNSTKSCVLDVGMALVVPSGDSWTLIGVSTLGPGCSLPSRFIKFFPYIPWINSISPKITQKTFRRTSYWYEENMTEPYEDFDSIWLERVSANSIVMMPSLAYLQEEVKGNCNNINDTVLMYREFGTIRAPTYTATAAYSLSVYDLLFPTITCVKVTVMCNKRSKIRYWVSSGFGQEDIEDYVKIVPISNRIKKPPKIWFLKDTYLKYRTIDVVNLEFKFEFTGEAKMDLEFYGLNISSPIQPLYLPYLPINLQTSGKLPQGAEFNAREETEDSDTNDSFYHF